MLSCVGDLVLLSCYLSALMWCFKGVTGGSCFLIVFPNFVFSNFAFLNFVFPNFGLNRLATNISTNIKMVVTEVSKIEKN